MYMVFPPAGTTRMRMFCSRATLEALSGALMAASARLVLSLDT
jgi:hypothetical protein